jgi:cysteine synthase A
MQGIEKLIGNTPLVELKKIQEKYDLQAKIYAKLEWYNPAGSIKDRVAKAIVDDAEKTGRLQKGGTVIEATSGNTGIGLALVAAARGYKAVIVMPNSMSVERQKLIKAYGAEIVLTDGSLGMKGAVEKAEELQRNTPNSVIAGQFDNPANARAHYETTGREIHAQTIGKTDIFVAGVGTGGTITGAGQYLKEQNPQTRVVAVEPAASPLLSKGYAAGHGIQGIGANFVPSVLNREVYDEIVSVTDEAALCYAREASVVEGLFVGISSGAALAAAVEIARREENAGKNIVVIFPDGGGRYLSTELVK